MSEYTLVFKNLPKWHNDIMTQNIIDTNYKYKNDNRFIGNCRVAFGTMHEQIYDKTSNIHVQDIIKKHQ